MKKETLTILFGVLIGFGVWILSILGMLIPLDGIVYDHLLVSKPILKSTPRPNLLIIQGSSQYRMADDKTWLVLLEQIEKQQPKRVVFTFMPTQASRHFYDKAGRYGNVVFGRRIVTSSNHTYTETLEEWPINAKDQALTFGVIRLPDSDSGVFRTQQKQVQINHQWHPLLEFAATQTDFPNQSQLPEAQSFRIDFSHGANSLPILSLERALTDDLVPELIRGRIVLIGLSDPEDNFIYTPLMTEHVKLTALQLHGYALETIASGHEIHILKGGWILLLILAVVVLSFFAFQWAPNKFLILLPVTLLGTYTLIAWFFLVLAGIWLPLAELWMTQVLVWIAYIYHHNKSEELQFQNMIMAMSGKLRYKLIPEYFYNSEEPWLKITAMVNQLVNLDRSIFLECNKEKPVVRAVTAFGCRIDQIHERRRDYRRTPYTTASEQNRMIKVDGYLENDTKGNQQYLMPLSFFGDIQGFWAFSLNNEKAIDARLEFFLNSFGEKIAELLYHREQWFRQKNPSKNVFSRYFNPGIKRRLSQDLEKLLSLAERRLTVTDDYLDHASVASIVYDLFGRALIINKQMLLLLKAEQIFPYDTTILDLLRSLTATSEEHARHILQSLMIDNEELKLDVVFSHQPEKFYVLRLSAINTRQKDLIERHGFLCELVDVTEIKQAYNFKETIREHLGFSFRNDLTSFILSVSLLEKDLLTEATRKRLLRILHIKSKLMTTILDGADQFLSVNQSLPQNERYPVDAKKAIHNAINSLREESLKREVNIIDNLSETIKLVYASPKMLEWVAIQALKCLLRDAQVGSKITMTTEVKERVVAFTFGNQGFGMPNELFQTYLTDGSSGMEDENIRGIKEAITLVRSWGGELQGFSEVGLGLTFILTLKGYL